MPSIINTNISSLNAQLNLGKSQAGLQTALQRLSSGLRINSAADDAAGLAISERMTSQINGLDQAARNANDGVSLSQTAEGGLSSIGDSLQRIRQLAVQSANSTNSSSDRAALNAEAQSLLAEIQRVASTTQFNGINLLDGTFAGSQFQVGANADQTITVNLQSSTPSALGSYGGASTSAVSAEGFSATNAISINGTTIGPSTATSTAGWTAGSAAAKAAAINAQTGVTGVSATASSTATGSTPLINSSLNNGDLTINGVAIGPIASSTSAATQGANAAAAINLQTNATGVTASADANTGKLTLTAADGRDITISSTSTSTAAKVLNATGLTADNGSIPTHAVSTATFTTGASHLATGSSVSLNGVTFTFSSTGKGNVVSSAAAVSVDVAASATGTQIAAALASAITSAATNAYTQSNLGQYTATSSNAVTTINDTKWGAAATTGDVALTVGSGTITAATTDGTDYVNSTFSNSATVAPQVNSALAAGALSINSTKIGAVTAGTTAATQGANAAAAINLLTSTTGVSATADANTGKLTLTSASGGLIKLTSSSLSAATQVLNATGLNIDTGQTATAAVSTATFKTGTTGISAGDTFTLNGVTFTFSTGTRGTNTVNSATSVTIGYATGMKGTSAAAQLAAAITLAATDATNKGTKALLGQYTSLNTAGQVTLTVTDNKVGAAATTGDAALAVVTSAHATVAVTTTGVDYTNPTFSSTAPSYQETLTAGDLIINGTSIGPVAAGTTGTGAGSQVANVAAAINLLTATTGVTAGVNVSTGGLTLTPSVAGTPIKVSAAAGKAEKVLTATGLTAYSGGTAPTQATSNVTFVTGAGSVTKGASVVLNGVTFTFSTATGKGATTVSGANVTIHVAAKTGGTTAAADLISALTTAKAATGNTAATLLGSYTAAALGATGVTFTDAKYGSVTGSGDTTALTATQTVTSNNTVSVATTSSSALSFSTGTTYISSGAKVVLNGVTFTFSTASTVSKATGNYAVQVHVAGSANAATDAAALAAAITTAEADATYGTTITSKLSGYTVSQAAGVITFTDAASANAGKNYAAGVLGQTTGGALGLTAGGSLTQTTGGDLTLSASSTFTVTGSGNGVADAGLSTFIIKQTKLSDLSIASVSGSNAAITTVDAALAQINSMRADMGALQNRFTSTVSSLQTASLNISAARSRIQDTDYAAETAALVRGQILQQAGTAMLAQANQLPNLVLSLLK